MPKSSRMDLFINKAGEKIYAHGIRCENKVTKKYPSSAVRRKYPKSNKYRILKMHNQYPHLQYSPSYSGTIHGTCEVQDFNYCMSFANAMQALLGQNYNSFLLTILSITVGFSCNGDGKFKMFDSHNLIEIHMVCPSLKKLLLEVNTLNGQINYFQMFYFNSKISPLKQIMQILKLQLFISPCYAVVPHLFKAFVFPSSNITLNRITDHANKFYKEKLNGNNHPLTIKNFQIFPHPLQSLVDIVKEQFHSKDVEYCIKFICCSTNMSNAGRQKVEAKHKSRSQKELHAKRRKESYALMEPTMKKKIELLSRRAELYKSLDPKEKEKLSSKSADQYKSLGSAEKQNLLSSRAIWYESLDTAQKQKRAEWFYSLNSAQKQERAEWYKSLNPEEKGKLLSGKAEWYITLDPADKDRVISQVQVNMEAYRNSVQHDLDYKITAFQSKIREGPYYICSVCNRVLYRKTVIQLK
ncbi:hypothetical protein pdam_00003311 [Pocillopora damicornis]|uniref:Uncharacterized protein n=1 Tax=Pocillopora damicornis TaxID=46731 RepID=A0A3M6TIA1_POCDA|nr:hypothetical protein pdam_00003311 [Pocillopora damicornis]